MIDPYSHAGIDLSAGFQARLDGRPRESCTSAEMELGWVKADEAVTHGGAQPRPPLPRRLRVPVAVAMGVLVLATGSYALLAHRNAAKPAPVVTTSYVVPDPTTTVDQSGWDWDDLGRHLHVVIHTEPAPVTKPQVAEGPSVDDVLAQLRAVAAARNALRHEHHTAHTAHAAETAPDLLRQGDALLEAGDVAAARVLYGRVAGNGTGSDAVQAADRLNQIDRSR